MAMPKVRRSRPVDVHVGSRVRSRRKMLGMSAVKLGAAIELSFQQVQKNERGTSRIGASRLYQLSKVLDVPVSYFFDDMPPEIAQTGQRRLFGFSESEESPSALIFSILLRPTKAGASESPPFHVPRFPLRRRAANFADGG